MTRGILPFLSVGFPIREYKFPLNGEKSYSVKRAEEKKSIKCKGLNLICCLEIKFIDMKNTLIYQEEQTESKFFSKP